jgi:hypothetical protein
MVHPAPKITPACYAPQDDSVIDWFTPAKNHARVLRFLRMTPVQQMILMRLP